MRLKASINGTTHELEIKKEEGGWRFRLNGTDIPADVTEISPDRISILIDGGSYDVRCGPNDVITVGERSYEVSLTYPRSWRGQRQDAAAISGPQRLKASMPGKVVRVLTSVGDKVGVGQGVLVIEAMKMQNEVRSPREGTVTAILVAVGSSVNAGEVVAIVE